MATIQDFEERIEKQKAELAKLEAKKKELEKKIRERNRKWRSLVTHSAGESGSPPSVALGRNSTSTHLMASLRATQTRCAPCSLSMEAPQRMPKRVSMHARRKR